MKYYIIVFKNTYDAMMAESNLEDKGYSFRIMPTPTSITQSCGICIRFDEEEELKAAREEGIEYKGIYLKEGNEYTQI
ncbi:MAG: DUF3343 domain-containing protein [Clostridium sp.]|uniref:DUF3343 domain-containing protein n=1 Tax=Clostridium sp. TaxID=1506 RepID=UPI003EE549E7